MKIYMMKGLGAATGLGENARSKYPKKLQVKRQTGREGSQSFHSRRKNVRTRGQKKNHEPTRGKKI